MSSSGSYCKRSLMAGETYRKTPFLPRIMVTSDEF